VINKSFDASHNSNCIKFILTLVDRKINLFELECLVLLWILNEQRRWVQTNQMCYFGHLEAAGDIIDIGSVDALWRRGSIWEGEADGGRAVWWKDLSSIQSLIGGGVRGGRRQEIQDICIIYLEAFSSSDPSAVLHPASLQPYWRRWNFDLGYALLGLFTMLALSCLCLAQVTICKHEVHLQGILQWWAPAL